MSFAEAFAVLAAVIGTWQIVQWTIFAVAWIFERLTAPQPIPALDRLADVLEEIRAAGR